MKILHVGKYYPPHKGGMETHLETLAERLARNDEVQVAVSSDDRTSARELRNGVDVRRLARWADAFGSPVTPALVPILRERWADVVHLHHPHPLAMVAWAAAGAPRPLVVTYHSDIVRQRALGRLFTPLLHAVLGRAAAIIVGSREYRDSSPVLAKHLARTEVVPFGLDIEKLQKVSAADVAAIRERFPGPLILGVGRLVYYKGFDVAIRAMTHVDGTLVIIGDGPLRGELSEQIDGRGLHGKVHLLGEIPGDITPWFHAAEIFVLPSIARSEAFGLVQIEAMAAGTPVVNTKLDSGVPFVSVHGETGLTVAPGDAGALASALKNILSDQVWLARMSRAAKERAATIFTVDAMATAVVGIYGRASSLPLSR